MMITADMTHRQLVLELVVSVAFLVVFWGLVEAGFWYLVCGGILGLGLIMMSIPEKKVINPNRQGRLLEK